MDDELIPLAHSQSYSPIHKNINETSNENKTKHCVAATCYEIVLKCNELFTDCGGDCAAPCFNLSMFNTFLIKMVLAIYVFKELVFQNIFFLLGLNNVYLALLGLFQIERSYHKLRRLY